jgi:hypothetical protein
MSSAEFQEASVQPRQLELQKVSLRDYGDLLEDSDFPEICQAPSLVLPSPETPLYNALLDKLCSTGDEDLMERLAELCIFDKLRHKPPCGSAEQPARYSEDPYSLGLRTENLLSVTNAQRANQLARLASRNDARANLPHALVFDGDDMKETMNEWRKQPQTWMDPRSLGHVKSMKNRQDYHKACKTRFNTMLFELFGNKSLVELCVRFPMCSAEQPLSILINFADVWRSFRDSPEANRARTNSQKKTEPGATRLSKQIYVLKQRQARGQWIADWIDENWCHWYQLRQADQSLWIEHNSGDITRRIAELQRQQEPRFPGAAECLASVQC